MTAALNPGDLERGSDLVALAQIAVTAETLGYGSLIASRVIARKPTFPRTV